MSGSISDLGVWKACSFKNSTAFFCWSAVTALKTFLPSGYQRLLWTKPPTTLATWPSSRFRWPISWP